FESLSSAFAEISRPVPTPSATSPPPPRPSATGSLYQGRGAGNVSRTDGDAGATGVAAGLCAPRGGSADACGRGSCAGGSDLGSGSGSIFGFSVARHSSRLCSTALLFAGGRLNVSSFSQRSIALSQCSSLRSDCAHANRVSTSRSSVNDLP